MTTVRTLEELHNLDTSYEIVMTFEGVSTRLGFSVKKTKGTLLSIACNNGELISSKMTETELDQEYTYSKKDGLKFGRVVIAFSGMTERDFAV